MPPAPHSKRRRVATPFGNTTTAKKPRPHSAPHVAPSPPTTRSSRRSTTAARSSTSATRAKTAGHQRKTPDSAHSPAAEERDVEKRSAERPAAEVESKAQFSSSERPKSAAVMTGSTWNYDDDGECGPQKWPNAVDGTRQSPIDLRLSKMNVITLQEPLQFVNYDQPLHGEFLNTGHSIQFIPESKEKLPEIFGGMLEQRYRFVQYHYHWSLNDHEGSEHALCGLRYPAELHLVHQGVEDANKLAVLGIFLHRGDGNHDALEPESEVLSALTEPHQRTAAKSSVNLSTKLPDCLTSFVRYEGSLTTPPCSENVTWTIFTDPLEISQKQLELLRSVKDYSGCVIRKNCRPLQRVNDRTVFLARK